jgi:large subunit ribosomal protein L25
MKTSFELVADPRDGVQGKGASRRLRRSGKVPAILYGGHNEPRQIVLDHQNLLTLLVNERFFSTILELKIKGEKQAAIVKDVQRHPAKNQILHMDLQRVLENEAIRMQIPLHFKGAAGSPGVKTQGGVVSHLLNLVQVMCLPKDLPEYLEIDLSAREINDIKAAQRQRLPRGRGHARALALRFLQARTARAERRRCQGHRRRRGHAPRPAERPQPHGRPARGPPDHE